MKAVVLIALAGALGALCRYGLVNVIGGRAFPWGTLGVNVLGACLMGYLYIMVVERMVWPAELKPLLMTGFLGAFTTFSAFSLEAWELFERGEWLMALAYILASVVLCIVGLGIGVMMARYTV